MQILIDTDPGIDDAIALLLALQCPDLDVVGITTVAGNVGLEQATRNAAGLLQLAERTDIPLHYGAAGPLSGPSRSSAAHGLDGLGGVALPHDRVEAAPDAARFIVDTVNANPGVVTLVTIGPLTNLALALELDPGLAGKTGGLMMMGGAEGAGNITPSAEFNFWCDPPAAQRVLAAGFPNPIMVGLDATHQAFMSPGVRELLYQIDHQQARFIFQITREYADYYWRTHRQVGAELCDVLAIALLSRPQLVKLVDAHVEISTNGITEGRSVVARTDRFRDLAPNAKVATSDVATREFFEFLLTTLFPDDRGDIVRVLDHEYRR